MITSGRSLAGNSTAVIAATTCEATEPAFATGERKHSNESYLILVLVSDGSCRHRAEYSSCLALSYSESEM